MIINELFLFVGNLVRCAYSQENKEQTPHYGYGDICNKMPYWKERPLRVAYIIDRLTAPIQLMIEVLANKAGFEYTTRQYKNFKSSIVAVRITVKSLFNKWPLSAPFHSLN